MKKVLVKNDLVEIDLAKSLKKAKKVSKKLSKKIKKETAVLINIAKKQTEVEKTIECSKVKIADLHKRAVFEAKRFNDSVARNFLDMEANEKDNLKALEASLEGVKAKYHNGVETVRKLSALLNSVRTDISCYEDNIEYGAYISLVNATKAVSIKKRFDTCTTVPEPTKEITESKYIENEALNRVKKDLDAIKKVSKEHEDPEVAALRKEK